MEGLEALGSSVARLDKEDYDPQSCHSNVIFPIRSDTRSQGFVEDKTMRTARAQRMMWLWVGLVTLGLTSRADAAYVSLLLTDVGIGTTPGAVTQYDAESGAPSGIGVIQSFTNFSPRGIAVDASGNIYVSDITAQTIVKYDGTTAAVDPNFHVSGLNGPGPVAIGPDGDIYVSLYNGSSINRYDPVTGAPIGTGVFATTGIHGPTGLAFGSNGNLYVANTDTSGLVELNGATGAVVKSVTGPGLINGPAGVSFGVGPGGTIYVANYSDNKILKFDSNLNYLGVFSSVSALNGPAGLAFDTNGKLIVVNNLGQNVIRLNADGTYDTTLITGLNQPLYAAFSNFQAVPEPGSMALMGIGLFAAAFTYRRKRSASAS